MTDNQMELPRYVLYLFPVFGNWNGEADRKARLLSDFNAFDRCRIPQGVRGGGYQGASRSEIRVWICRFRSVLVDMADVEGGDQST